jgi:hypothetical protein
MVAANPSVNVPVVNNPGPVKPPLSTLQPNSSFGATINTGSIPLLSTNQATQYFMSAFMAQVNVGEDVDGGGPLYLDMLDPRIETLLDSLVAIVSIMDNLSSPITTLIYRLYGNTSLWWLILMFNGIIHPLERTAGSLQMPDTNVISSNAVQINTPSRRGTTVVI